MRGRGERQQQPLERGQGSRCSKKGSCHSKYFFKEKEFFVYKIPCPSSEIVSSFIKQENAALKAVGMSQKWFQAVNFRCGSALF